MLPSNQAEEYRMRQRQRIVTSTGTVLYWNAQYRAWLIYRSGEQHYSGSARTYSAARAYAQSH